MLSRTMVRYVNFTCDAYKSTQKNCEVHNSTLIEFFLKNADSFIPCLTGKTSSKNCEGHLGHACLHLTPERAYQPLTCGSCICLLRDVPPRGPMEPHYRVLPSHQKPQGGPRTGAQELCFFSVKGQIVNSFGFVIQCDLCPKDNSVSVAGMPS